MLGIGTSGANGGTIRTVNRLTSQKSSASGGLLWLFLASKIQRQKFLGGVLFDYDGHVGLLDTANADRGLVAGDSFHAKPIHREMIVQL
jgi:hypothetical protein